MNTHDPRPMAVDPSLLSGYSDLFRYRAGTLPSAVVEAALAAAPRRQTPQAGAVAVIPLHGLILRRPSFIDELFGAASLEGFMAAVRAAVANPDISAVVLDIDSPGGEVDGCTEAATELRALRAQKPITAIADTMAASAAYWLGSQATEFAVSPSGGAGAIGVYMIYDDISGMLEQEGVIRTVLSAGKFKEASVGGLPLSEAARGQFQSLIDAHYAAMTTDIAKGRGVAVSKVRGGFGEGLYLSATAAKDEGLADRIASLPEVLRSPAMRTGTKAEDDAPAIVAALIEPDPIPEPDPEPEPPKADLELYRRRAMTHVR